MEVEVEEVLDEEEEAMRKRRREEEEAGGDGEGRRKVGKGLGLVRLFEFLNRKLRALGGDVVFYLKPSGTPARRAGSRCAMGPLIGQPLSRRSGTL